ncbi:MAG: hypothetical protein WDN45_14895 [Caulobacteraceae bacterium]
MMSGLEVRSPVPPAKSNADLADQMLAHARAGQGEDPLGQAGRSGAQDRLRLRRHRGAQAAGPPGQADGGPP